MEMQSLLANPGVLSTWLRPLQGGPRNFLAELVSFHVRRMRRETSFWRSCFKKKQFERIQRTRYARVPRVSRYRTFFHFQIMDHCLLQRRLLKNRNEKHMFSFQPMLVGKLISLVRKQMCRFFCPCVQMLKTFKQKKIDKDKKITRKKTKNIIIPLKSHTLCNLILLEPVIPFSVYFALLL